MTGKSRGVVLIIEKTPRRRWDKRDEYTSVCERCELKAYRRPDPYSRRWFTEWTREADGFYAHNYNGGKTPPCDPIAVEVRDEEV
ncbi:hypothetical protein [Microbispora sp. NPDC049125]|uniref:hypothetical protein n=1 Tax=Microbispora sp. NPDC049125 TaxID=3154929 RepID=UPI0034678C9A